MAKFYFDCVEEIGAWVPQTSDNRLWYRKWHHGWHAMLFEGGRTMMILLAKKLTAAFLQPEIKE